MKKFDYKKKPSIIRTLKEPPRKRKKINWDRAFFIGALCVGLFFLARYTYRNVALVEADGQVILESVRVNFINDIRLQSLHVSEGDTVARADTLFTYWNELHNDDGVQSVQISNSRDWIKKEVLTLQAKISQKKAEISGIDQLLEEYKKRLDVQVQTVMLDASDHSGLQSTKNQVIALNGRNRLLNSELRILQGHLNQLKKEQREHLGVGGYSSSLTRRSYVSNKHGIIGEIQIQPNEVCYEGEYVFTIHSPEEITIHAYFEQEHISRIFVRRMINIEFPDGSRGQGYIKKYHISTKELPPEFQKKYEPTERTILAEIAPIDEESADLWKKFYKMNVKVSFPKYKRETYFSDEYYTSIN